MMYLKHFHGVSKAANIKTLKYFNIKTAFKIKYMYRATVVHSGLVPLHMNVLDPLQ